MHRFVLFAALVALLISCEQATSHKDTKKDPPPSPAAPVGDNIVAVTASNIVGTWKQEATSSETENEVTETSVTTETWTFASDGTFFRSIVEANTSTDPAVTSTTDYSEYEGTWSIAAGQITISNTQSRSAAAPLTASDLWQARSGVGVESAAISDGVLYLGSIWQPQGVVNGLVGTWEHAGHYLEPDDDYYSWGKGTWSFAADGSYHLIDFYSELEDGTFPTEPDTDEIGTYTAANGVFTTTGPSGATHGGTYKLNSSYLILNWGAAKGFTKQP